MRYLGLDIGNKRIGVAVTDEKNTIAYPLEVLENTFGIKEKLETLIEKYHIDKIVVGLPYNLKGHEGQQAKIVREFVDANLNDSAANIVFTDERFTSKISESILKEEDIQKKRYSGRAKKKRTCKEIDKISASIILSSYIEKEKKNNL